MCSFHRYYQLVVNSNVWNILSVPVLIRMIWFLQEKINSLLWLVVYTVALIVSDKLIILDD